jgi:hypothetical protein
MQNNGTFTRAIGAILFIIGIPLLCLFTPVGFLLIVAGVLIAIQGAVQQYRERAESRRTSKRS